MNEKLQEILKKHNVGLFEFVNVELGKYVLRTDKPASRELQDELTQAFGSMFDIGFELLPEHIQPLLPGMGLSLVAHPPHYNSGKIEVIEAIEDWKLNYHRGNAVKYVAHAGKKDPTKEVEDLEKAIWYLRREVERLQAVREGRDAVKPNDMNPKKGTGAKLPEELNPELQFLAGEWIEVELEDGGKVMAFSILDDFERFAHMAGKRTDGWFKQATLEKVGAAQ